MRSKGGFVAGEAGFSSPFVKREAGAMKVPKKVESSTDVLDIVCCALVIVCCAFVIVCCMFVIVCCTFVTLCAVTFEPPGDITSE